jgi:REP element-mobilizing transposase RayT
MLNQNMNTRKQLRLSDYDYSENGWYFITVCSRDRDDLFGGYTNIVGAGLASARNPQIQLSPIGAIIERRWKDIPNQYEGVELDEYVVMPNHIHGIIVINQKKRADARPAPTISYIVCSFKSRAAVECLKYIKENNLNLSGRIWQRSFYDHVIRNERSLNTIREYISMNPANRGQDIDNIMWL